MKKILLISLFFMLFGFGCKSKVTESTTVTTTPQITDSATALTEQSPTTTPKTIKKTITIKVTTPPATLSYSDMIKKYGGYRFQFSKNCSQVSPGAMVIKSGAQFVVDNREDQNHVFTFSGQKYYVKPYGYAVVTAGATGKQAVLCDGIQRATVEVAK